MAGYVYLIGSRQLRWYKIGKSSTPEIRIKDIGILLPFKIQVHAVWRADNHTLMESVLHEMYGKHKINGEWFLFDESKVQSIISKEISGQARIFPRKDSNSMFVNFRNVERDFLPKTVFKAPKPDLKQRLTERLNAAYSELARLKRRLAILEEFTKIHGIDVGEEGIPERQKPS